MHVKEHTSAQNVHVKLSAKSKWTGAMWRKMWPLDQTVNQVMQKTSRQVELLRMNGTEIGNCLITDLFSSQLWMSGIGFDYGEETLQPNKKEMTASKAKSESPTDFVMHMLQ